MSAGHRKKCKLTVSVVAGQTAGDECCNCTLLEVTNFVDECLIVEAKVNKVELSCLVDTGSQVTTIAKPVYDACLPSTVRQNHTLWVNLKATDNSPI